MYQVLYEVETNYSVHQVTVQAGLVIETDPFLNWGQGMELAQFKKSCRTLGFIVRKGRKDAEVE